MAARSAIAGPTTGVSSRRRQRRLRTQAAVDHRPGHRPAADDVRRLTVAFNGEIYNYVELRDELKRAGHEFRTTSDTEVILRMYVQYGTDAIARLNGMFAFVLYDSRRRHVVAARDHFGIKPLY